MKNIHVLSEVKLIKSIGDLVKDQYGDTHIFTKNDSKEYGKTTTKLNIYITNDEEIKEGDWKYNEKLNCITQHLREGKGLSKELKISASWCKKIILTDNPDLIADGVQAIDDEFLEWFIKNPSCEFVETFYSDKDLEGYWRGIEEYQIIIPKEDWLLNNPQCKQIESCSKSLSKKCICPKEEPKLANRRCTCMSFEPNCFTGSCRKCGFLPQEEPKLILCGYPDKHYNCKECGEPCGLDGHFIEKEEEPKQYKVIIVGDGLPKQQTLEEAAERFRSSNPGTTQGGNNTKILNAFKAGAKWQQEQDKKLYSEEDMKHVFFSGCQSERQVKPRVKCWEEFIEQFKKK